MYVLQVYRKWCWRSTQLWKTLQIHCKLDRISQEDEVEGYGNASEELGNIICQCLERHSETYRLNTSIIMKISNSTVNCYVLFIVE